MTDHLRTDFADGIAWLTFNRPGVRNATSVEMLQALHATLLRIEADEQVRVVVLRGAGDHFMAGGDIRAFAAIADEPPAERRAAMQQRLSVSAPIFSLLQRLPQPVLGSVRGAVAGGGVGFLLACDLAIAGSDARFVLSHVRLGLSPDGSSTWHLPRAAGMKKAKQMALLGQAIDAPTALEWGLVNEVVAPGEVSAATERIARQLSASSPRALAQAKRLLNASLGNSLAEQVALEGEAIGLCAETPDFVAGLRSFQDRRNKP